MSVELTEALLSKAAGWEAMKNARSLVAGGRVLSSDWTPPMLKGVVQEGASSYRAGLVIKGPHDLENLCTCRPSRQWGLICAHSVAVGVHVLTGGRPAPSPAPGTSAVKPEPRPDSKPGVGAGATRPVPGPRPKALDRLPPGSDGDAASLHVLLPPLLANGAPRGTVMIYFEAKSASGRRPLDAFAREGPWVFDAADAKVLDEIEQISGGGAPGFMQISVADFNRLAALLVDHPRVTLGKAQPVRVTRTPWAPALSARLESNGEIVLTPKATGSKPAVFREGNGAAWVFTGPTLQPAGGAGGVVEKLLNTAGPVRLDRRQVPGFLGQDWPSLAGAPGVEANFKLDQFQLSPMPPKFILELVGMLSKLQARLQCRYGVRVMAVGAPIQEDGLWIPDPSNPFAYATRDLAAEQQALVRLRQCGFQGPDTQGRYQLSGEDAVLRFLAREFPRMQKEWEVTLEEALERATAKGVERIEPRFQIVPSGEQWFDLHVAYSTDSGLQLPAAEIQRLIRSGQSHTRLKNGKLAVIDTGAVEELQEILVDCGPTQSGGAYRVSQAQAGFLDASIGQNPTWRIDAPGGWKDRVGKQAGAVELKPSALGGFESVLRPYQRHGVGWLEFLRQSGFGGILADEMGLGKTVQTLAFLGVVSRELRARGGGELAALIVCPTSLVFNWAAEARRFAPDLRVLPIQGPQRSGLFARMAEHDIVITSYALLRRDLDHYKHVAFDSVILDEAQHIKNRQTQNAQAVKSVRSRHRFVLTGTPMENSVFDVWSIFDFLMPGYLGNADHFKERYELPITRDKDTSAQARLSRRLRPFMLRRLKRDVVKDLPEKLEQVSLCEMTEDQASLYRQILDAGRKEVLETAGKQGQGKGRIAALNALLRLRQVCCDARLLKLEGFKTKEPSGKLELFGELLEEIIDGGHRALVFSQFVSMLTLLREHLDAESIPYCYLDGSTNNRGEVVERFQKDGTIPIFLISLKAGGTGLNLASADTVIHFDPWWNPAVEDQATDRAHRIGQTRVVTSYKLITRGTVEEKILALQQRKRALIKATLSGEETLAEDLTWEEIQGLFE